MKKQFIRFAKELIERAPRLAMTYRCVRDNWQRDAVPQQTDMGFKFVGNQSIQCGQFEPEETEIVQRIFPQVDVVVNIGANIGYYCCVALSKGKPVVAFEPVNLNLHYLLKNIKANHWESKIEIYPVALSDKIGVAEMYGGGTGASLLRGFSGTSEWYKNLVPSTTLDTILGSRFHGKKCLMIVDVEGAEPLLLAGAASILGMEPKPIWMMEITIADHLSNGIGINQNLLSTFQFFWNAGYDAYTANRQSRIVSRHELEEIIRSGLDTLGVYNFIFVESGKGAWWSMD